MISPRFRIAIFAALLAGFVVPVSAQTRPGQEKPPAQQPGGTKGPPPVRDSLDPVTSPDAATEELMRRTISDLSTQIGLLAQELRRLRGDSERNSGLMELLLAEQRLFQLEEKIQDALDQKAVLDARELEFQRRSKNIQQELLYRAAIRREDAEAQIRAELQKALDDVHSQQTSNHQRLAELQAQADRLRRRSEVLRRKYEQREGKAEEDKEK
jgi:hypothetical protein